MTAPGVQRSTELDLDTASTLAALTDPEMLSVWLGRWEQQHARDAAHLDPAGRSAIVTTDDGIRRSVDRLVVRPDGVRWRWAPVDSPEDTSEVTMHLEAIAPNRTRLTVTEVQASATGGNPATTPVALDAIKWSICLLVLEIAAAQTTTSVSV